MKYRRDQNVGLFDKENTLQELLENGNPLPKLKEIMDFEQFRSILEPVFGRLTWKYRVNNPDSLSGAVDMAYGYCDDHQPHAVRRIYDYQNLRYFDFRWDRAGNLGQVSAANENAIFESGRFLYWTEDSRMHAAVDDRYYSYYAYDHSGERRLKLTGDNKLLDVNANFMATYTVLKEQTLYPSAYMVLTNRGYTKHYYAGAERVAARLGGGGLNAMGNAIGYSDTLLAKADTLFGQSLEQVNSRALNGNDIDCILGNGFAKEEFGHPIDGIPCQMQAGVDFYHDPFKDMVHSMQFDCNNGQEREVYFYHSDHLGSASWITDSGGQAIQHLQYLPYGERFVDQRTSGYCERFTFTGKERDEETGYGYFGARYMDYEMMTMWLSVDPMSDKYPGISPYAYCVWNPVKLVDPDGRDIVIHHGKYDYHLKMEKDKENGKYTFRWISRQNGIDVELSNNNTEKINEDLSKLMDGPEGNRLVSTLCDDKGKKVTVNFGGKGRADKKGENIYYSGESKHYEFVKCEDAPENYITPSYVVLAHELAHIEDRWYNKCKDLYDHGSDEEWCSYTVAGRNVTRGYTEKYATEIENKVRYEHNEPQRQFYYYYGNQSAGACTIVPKKNGN